MMKMFKPFFLAGVMALLLASVCFAGGQVKLVVNDQTIESGEELGAYLVLDGDGTYDVYAALTGGVLGDQLFVFDETGNLVPLTDPTSIPKLRANLNFSTLSVQQKLIQLLPKIPLSDTSSLKGTYTFYAALCTPGQMDFPVLDFISVTIE